MTDPNKYRTAASNSQMLRDINKNLQHLHAQKQQQQQLEQQNLNPVLQSQNSFEQQLSMSSNINALAQSSAGDRWSFPRTTNKAHALEEIRKNLLPFAWRNGATLPHHTNGCYFANSTKFQSVKSSSFTDLNQAVVKEQQMPADQQQKVMFLSSKGYDEVLAAEILRNDPNKSIENVAEMLKSISLARNLKPTNYVTQVQRSPPSYNIASYNSRSTSSNMNSSQSRMQYSTPRFNSHHYTKPPTHDSGYRPSYSSNQAIFDSQSIQRQYSGEDKSNGVAGEYNPYSQASYSDKKTHPAVFSVNPEMHSTVDHIMQNSSKEAASWKVQKSIEKHASRQFEGVTLRAKPFERKMNPQNRWSAEVLNNAYDYADKRNSMETIPNKPPPPYPGAKPALKRISSQDREVVGTNNPVTVIFDEKNDRVNVVGGVPEGYESMMTSSPSSSGQSSPRSLQKEPPPYSYGTSVPHQIRQFSPKSSLTQITPLHPVQQQHPPQQQPEHVFAVPQVPTHSQKPEAHFVPINESSRRDRGSPPPPYPGFNTHRGSNRSSINLDELESSAFQSYSSGSGSSSKKTSTATEPGSFNQSDSSASTSPTPDGVERSYSPLPTFTSPCHTMVVHSKDKKERQSKDESVPDQEPFSTRLKNYTPQAYKFYMEQHVENLLKLQEQRRHRRRQLEAEMARVGLPEQAQEEMRKLLNQKESNYIRLKRAKMDKSMFSKIKVVGVGAFGEVALVRKNGTSAYYAMKTLRKSVVLRRNQVAHVKAERDILAEADNEWVVKLYYSFQNEQNLYFVMDYVPGGDLMALLIKLGIFREPLARFYISELVLAIESVHKLGFIHRDIKPDNVLIDSNGHIKLTDFGLCTGFRWTHDSKYYQPEPEGGGHTRQFSMEPEGGWESMLNDVDCNCKSHRLKYDLCKPLERRQLRRHMRCQAHSLVGTPNYIAPEVLMRIPYSQQCDWWSVGVILYEMIIGQPPFFAHSAAETQLKVINWQQTLTIPKRLPKESEDLIRRLCAAPDERLGKDNADEIKQHPYFSGVNFSTIHQEKAPYIPTIRNPTDTSNFDPVPENMCNGSDSDGNTPDEEDTKKGPEYAFYEFTFRHFFDDGGIANSNVEMPEKEAKPKALNHVKRSATTSNKSMSVPSKVAAHSPSASEEKAPVYV